jgi:hypothetical protein
MQSFAVEENFSQNTVCGAKAPGLTCLYRGLRESGRMLYTCSSMADGG